MLSRIVTLPVIVAAAVLLSSPLAALADRKDGEKQRMEKWDEDSRDYGYRPHGWNAEDDKEWRKGQKERDKDRRQSWKEREKDRREAAREWEKDQREAERERYKDRREAEREALKDGRNRDYRYSRRPIF
jgi:gas vesicle protein